VLTEEALIFLVALGALGLVVLGTLELLWPSRPKHPVRRAPAPAARATPPPEARKWRSSRPRHAVRGEREPYVRPLPPLVPTTTPARPVPPFTLAALIRPPAPPAVPGGLEPAAAPAIASEARPEPATSVVEAAVTAETPAVPRVAAVDRCFELYEARRYAEVVTLASAALGDVAPSRGPAGAQEAAALWSVLALAQQALGDHLAARRALEEAITAAPEADRPAYQRQLGTLALDVAQNLVAAAGAHTAPDSEGRVTDLRDALAWLEDGRAAAPADAALRELAATAETLLWPAYEQVVMALVQRQEFRAARRLLREALDHPRVPAARAETFRELFSGTFSGEIGQLTAQAIRSMQEARETEALGALERAEGLLDTIHDEALPPKRREEVDRRLWWGYNRLGLRRVEAGAFEDAIEPLLRALRLAGTAPDRQSETRAALVQAFEGWTEARALAIREVADGGDREAALVQSDRLWTRLRAAIEEGLSEGDLAGAFVRVRRLFEEIGRERE
jgi:tetratricopeptide (TPR) repeat protein